MIISAILKFIAVVVNGVAKICAFILVKLGLWLPAIFAFVFIIFCAISGIKLQGVVIVLFIAGTIMMYVVSILISLNRRYKLPSKNKKKEKRVRANMQKVNLKNEAANLQTTAYREAESLKFENPPIQPEIPIQERAQRSDFSSRDYADLERKYFIDEAERRRRFEESLSNAAAASKVQPVKAAQNELKPATEAALDTQRGVSAAGSSSKVVVPPETPMVFATRSNPNIIIYEYRDRLEFYKKTKKGLEYTHTVPKG